jgi:hypothetical protein
MGESRKRCRRRGRRLDRADPGDQRADAFPEMVAVFLLRRHDEKHGQLTEFRDVADGILDHGPASVAALRCPAERHKRH